MICVLTLLLQMHQSIENNLSLSREMDIADMCRANEHSINPVDHARQSKFLNDFGHSCMVFCVIASVRNDVGLSCFVQTIEDLTLNRTVKKKFLTKNLT